MEAFHSWKAETYTRQLSSPYLQALVNVDRSNSKLWKAMRFDEKSHSLFLAGKIFPTQGEIMGSSGILCKQSLTNLPLLDSGTHESAMLDQRVHEVMCGDFCLINDLLRSEAINVTGCSCLELSLQSDDPLYKYDGSFCFENSARYLCSELGRCGKWDCELQDFQCKRMEYDKVDVPLKGKGGQCSAASSILDTWIPVAIATLASFLVCAC